MTNEIPVRVHVVNHPHPDKFEIRSAFRTAVLTAANPYVQIASPDPLRVMIRFSEAANPFIICGSISQASDANNVAATLTNPNGRLVGAGSGEAKTIGQNEIWLVAATYPTMVGYEIVRKVPEK